MKYLTIASALFLAGCSAYFSVIGIIAIFPGNSFYAGIAAAALEFGKICTALLLHKHWKNRSILGVRPMLLVFTLLLMLLTSLGIFGMFSKGAQVHGAAGEINASKLSFIDDQIARNSAKKTDLELQLKNLNSFVGIYTKESKLTDASKGIKLYSKQKSQRKELESEITGIETKNNDLYNSKLDLQQKQKTIEVDVGPAIYFASIIYGNKDPSSVESAIKIIICMIVFVFDPLTICLLIACQAIYFKEEDVSEYSNILQSETERQSDIGIITNSPSDKIKIISNVPMQSNITTEEKISKQSNIFLQTDAYKEENSNNAIHEITSNVEYIEEPLTTEPKNDIIDTSNNNVQPSQNSALESIRRHEEEIRKLTEDRQKAQQHWGI